MAIALACTLAYDMCSGSTTGTIGGHTGLRRLRSQGRLRVPLQL
ncbi:MAG: hypothetical protein U0935_00345 [Pirellulales bacterium]